MAKNKRYSEDEYNKMSNQQMISAIDAMDRDFAASYVPPKVKVRYFVSKYGKELANSIKGTGILFSVAVAQNMLESTFGKSTLAQYHNNFGGIKAVSGYPSVKLDTTEYNSKIPTKASFASFPSPKISFDHYVAIVKKVAPSALALKDSEQQVKLIAKGDGAYYDTKKKKPIGYTTTSPNNYWSSIEGNVDRVVAMYPNLAGKIL